MWYLFEDCSGKGYERAKVWNDQVTIGSILRENNKVIICVPYSSVDKILNKGKIKTSRTA